MIGKDRIRKETDSVNPKWGEARAEGEKALGMGGRGVQIGYIRTQKQVKISIITINFKGLNVPS